MTGTGPCRSAPKSRMRGAQQQAERRLRHRREGGGDQGDKIFFLDFEASSLDSGSRPIEIAWVDEEGRGESYLIKPAPSWRDWSAASQRVHGISQEMLEREGAPHAQVARRAAAVLSGASVFADQPSFDGYWLRMLLEAAGMRDEIPVLDVTLAYGQACRPIWDEHDAEGSLARARRIVAEAEEAEATRRRVRHRALPDAEGLWWRWQEIRRRVAAIIAGR